MAVSALVLLSVNSLFAQNETMPKAKVVHSIGGLPVPDFYTIISVIFQEFLIVFTFLGSTYGLNGQRKRPWKRWQGQEE